MRTTQPLTITLPHEMANMVKAKVASGEYATESEVIREGLRALTVRDGIIEKWLLNEVAATIDAHDADPNRAISGTELKKRLDIYMDKAEREGL